MLRISALAALVLVVAGLAAAPAQGDQDDDLVTAAGQRLDARVIAEVADHVDQSSAEVTELLESDATARVTGGRLAYHDTFEPVAAPDSEPAPRASAPLSKTFDLHSRPGGKRVIYLDFDGERVCNSGWTHGDVLAPCINAPRFDTDGRSGFSAGERRAIQSTWRRVAEDFAPFAVDVTTERPTKQALNRAGKKDKRFGVHAVVTSSNAVRNRVCGGPGCGGVAFVDVFDRHGANNQRVFWVFPNEVQGKARRIADIASHEAGHTLGLSHDGKGTRDYYTGQGIWAPLMGSSNRRLTQWSRGEYAGATNHENDLAVIASNGAPRVRDDHGDTERRATRLRPGRPRKGVIRGHRDVDVFKLRTTCRARLKVTVRNAGQSPNLDARLRLTNRAGKVLARRNPLSSARGSARGLDATYAGRRRAGVFFVRVDGVGARRPATTGYSAYGSLGGYRVRFTSRCGA